MGVRRVLESLPDLFMGVDEAHAPVVMIGEGTEVEHRDIARIGVEGVRSPGAISELAVAVEVAPAHTARLRIAEERVAHRAELGFTKRDRSARSPHAFG